MVKGISRQVILVQAPGEELFDQAIFILRQEAVTQGVTDEMLMKEANRLLRESGTGKRRFLKYYGPAWACCGAALMGLVWLVTAVL